MKLLHVQDCKLTFYCPGCQAEHLIFVDLPGAWTWNRNLDKPSVSPSILVRAVVPLNDSEIERVMNGEHVEPVLTVCHSFIEDGKIRFLNDCTHDLAGQIVDIPEE